MSFLRSLLSIGLLCWFSAATTFLPLGAAGAQPEDATQPGRHALLVGCTKYPSLVLFQQLAGPANDVQLVRTLLIERFQFTDEQITVLSEDAESSDHRPIRANIEREFRRLASTVKSGDQVVILMAGHGSQQPDNDPNNPEDAEPDGLDEIFLPSDIGAWDGSKQQVENAISDDEIRGWISQIRGKGGFVWVIIDACHSGTMIRGGGEEVLRQVPPDALVPESVLRAAARRAASLGEVSRGAQPTGGVLDVAAGQAGVVAIYAAQSSEPTIEKPLPPDATDRTRYGLLTYTINQVLTRASTPLTYRELAQRVHQQYQQWGRSYPTPMLEGTNPDREVLGQTAWAGRSRILLSRLRLGVFAINAGGLHGMTAGSILRVLPPAGETDHTQPLGHVRVESVRALESVVRPCDYDGQPAPTDLPEGARCNVVFQDFGALRLRVAVDPLDLNDQPVTRPVLAQVSEALSQLDAHEGSLVQAVTHDAKTDWLLRVGDNRVFLVPASGRTRTPQGDEAASLAPSPLFGPAPIDPGLGDWLGERLQRIARVRNLTSLATQEGASVIGYGAGVSVQVELVRYQDETSTDFEVIPWDSGRTLRAGEIVEFRATNRGRQAVDVTFLFIDSEYGITPYFPRAGSLDDNRVEPGKTLASPRAQVTPSNGEERMVVIAARPPAQGERIDFSFFAQSAIERVRGERNANRSLQSPLGQLLQNAIYATGGTRGLNSAAVDNYAVRQLSWEVVADDR